MRSKEHDTLRDRLIDAMDTARPVDLPPDLARHLHDCAECSAHIATRRRISAALRSLPLAEPPSDLADRIFHASLRVDRSVRRLGRRLVIRRVLVALPLAAAATIALVAWFGGNRPQSPQIPRLVFKDETWEMRQARNSPFSLEILQEGIRRVAPPDKRG